MILVVVVHVVERRTGVSHYDHRMMMIVVAVFAFVVDTHHTLVVILDRSIHRMHGLRFEMPRWHLELNTYPYRLYICMNKKKGEDIMTHMSV